MPIYINNRRLVPMKFMEFDDEENLGNPIDMLGDIVVTGADLAEEDP